MEKKEQECGTTVAFAAQHGFYSITFGLIPGWLIAQTNYLTLWTQKAKPTQSPGIQCQLCVIPSGTFSSDQLYFSG